MKVKGARDYSNRYKPVDPDPKPLAPNAPTSAGQKNPVKNSRFDKLGGYARKGEKVFPGRGEIMSYKRG